MRISDWSSDVCSSDLLAALFYVSNWAVMAGEAGFDHINHLWSLSVEEQFYIVWPVILMVAGRRALPVALLGIVASAAWRAHLYDGVWLDVYSRTDARADAFLVGCCLALSPRLRRALSWGATPGLLVFAAAVVWLARDDKVLYDGGFTVVAIACAAMIAGVVERGRGRLLLDRTVLVVIGVAPYCVYL